MIFDKNTERGLRAPVSWLCSWVYHSVFLNLLFPLLIAKENSYHLGSGEGQIK